MQDCVSFLYRILLLTVFLDVLPLPFISALSVCTDPSQLPTDTYDFVIVGAGAAGSVIAARLTEDPLFSVLLIEAGISNEGIPEVQIPFLAPSNLPYSAVTWNYSTSPQVGLDKRVLSYTRGRVLGGSSSINFQAYTRGSDEEYDRWAELTGDNGWAWNNMSQYYLKSSKLVPSASNRSTDGLVDPSAHGQGPIDVSLPGFSTEIDYRYINASKLSGTEFPFAVDMNAGNSIGFGLVQSTVGNGERSSSATAYLEPALNRTNLHVLIHNTVTRLLPTGTINGLPAFKKVEFSSGSTAPRSVVTATKEVILAAGAIGTPQILMLSGVGDKLVLEQLGIQPRLDIPDVGQNLQDHPILASYWNVASTSTFDDILRDPTLSSLTLSQWEANRTGRFVDSPVVGIGFMRLPENSAALKGIEDPAAGVHSGHYELIFADGYGAESVPQPATGHFLTVFSVVVSPLSKGSVTLVSSDPFVSPIIDPGFFTSTFDQHVMTEAVRSARRFVEMEPWKGFVLSPFGTMGKAEMDDEIVTAARSSIETIWHPTCTARMSPRNASWGVVTPDLLVKGASGLRIVDASIFPIIPAAHPIAMIYAIAERAADMIKKDWRYEPDDSGEMRAFVLQRPTPF